MSLRMIQLLFSLTWFLIGLALFASDQIAPEWVARQQFNVNHAGIFAFLLAVWNLRRWFITGSQIKARELAKQQAAAKKPPADRPYEYNPEFDFSKQDPASPQ